MTNQMMLYLVPVILIGLALFYFSRTNKGEQLIDQNLHPKPDLTKADSWVIGPVTDQGNQSQNMPTHPTAGANGLVIDMPKPECQPHYITVNYGSLTGKKSLTIKGTIEGGPFFAKDGVSQASLCLYFQRQFDDWAATISHKDGALGDTNYNTQYYRWYATGNALLPLVAGPFELTVSFTDKWTALRAESEDSLNPNEGATFFKQAIDNAGEVGFVLGGGDGWGHGIMATAPSKIIIESYQIV